MKKFVILFLTLLIINNFVFANDYKTSDFKIFASKKGNLYGIKDKSDNVVVETIYKKIIRLGDNSWIVQNKRNKFGLIDCSGNVLVKAKYEHAERLFDRWVKLGNSNDYGLYDTYGKTIIPPQYSAIEPLFGHKFLTCQKYKYGVYSDTGKMLIPNKYDFIYTPSPNVMRIRYQNEWIELQKINKDDTIDIPKEQLSKLTNNEYIVERMVVNTGVGTGYGVITAADYSLKILSTFSNAYEDTIDELMFSKGVDSVPVIMNFTWLPKFPLIFAKKYYYNIFTPDKSPLSSVRIEIKEQMK